jgi:hypothetical protein
LSRIAESHRYLAEALWPEQRERAVETMMLAFCELLPPAERAPWRPRRVAIAARLRKLLRRYRRGVVAGAIAAAVALERWPGSTTLPRAVAHNGARIPAHWRSGAPRNVLRDVWRPYRDVAHLLVPLTLARHPDKLEIYRRHPELVAPAVPADFPGLITGDRWARQATQVAAMWRLLLDGKI